MPAPLVVGIDLGTTHTVVAVADPEHPDVEVLRIPQLVARGEIAERELLPSFLFAPPDAEGAVEPPDGPSWIVGAHARHRGREAPNRLVASAKSWLVHSRVDRRAAILPWGVEDESVPRLSPVEASARILDRVRVAFERRFPGRRLREQQVVLTIPASFDPAARALTVEAATAAGLAVRLLEEPLAAFYDHVRRDGTDRLAALVGEREGALVLVCDVGGGTTDLTLVRASVREGGAIDLARVAVGRHLLLGGDNLDLALAHLVERRMVADGERLDPRRLAQLGLACREGKERLLGPDPPESQAIRIAGVGSALVGGTLSAELGRAEVEDLLVKGFLPDCPRDAEPARRGRAGLVAFGLPYEHDPAITRHVAAFLTRHAPGVAPRAVLFNGGLFHAQLATERLTSILRGWSGEDLAILPQPHPDVAVARGAVAFGLALGGKGLRVAGGAAHGYYVALDATSRHRRALCVVPRGSQEGERHLTRVAGLALTVGRMVRFELLAADSGPVHAPGEIVEIDDERFELLPPVATAFSIDDTVAREVPVAIEGELTAVGTVELRCVEEGTGADPRRFPLVFELRGAETDLAPRPRATAPPPSSVRSLGKRFDEATEAVQRVFGKGRKDVAEREPRDLVRNLERLLGDRRTWDTEVCRALFDVIAPKHAARRRSADHERAFWHLAGFGLRPGFGHPLDAGRVRLIEPLFGEGLVFGKEVRGWEQFFIAWRRIAPGATEALQVAIRDLLDPHIAPAEAGLRKPKAFKPLPVAQLLELASWLERVPHDRRRQLGAWMVDRTYTDRDPQLWDALGRIGARVPIYASAHQALPARAAEQWLDHLLRERWGEISTAPRAAFFLARATGDRARDVAEARRAEVARRLEQVSARPDWIHAVREVVEVADAERAELFGEELPVGLRLAPA